MRLRNATLLTRSSELLVTCVVTGPARNFVLVCGHVRHFRVAISKSSSPHLAGGHKSHVEDTGTLLLK